MLGQVARLNLLDAGLPASFSYEDMLRTLRHPEVLQRPESPDGVFTFDLARQGREETLK